jgi:hypothetical protein
VGRASAWRLLALGITGASVLVASGAAWSASSPPSVSVTTPTNGSTVKGTVTVTASATAGSGDSMSSISFYDGVNYINDGSCQGQSTCTVSVQWKATGLSGQHSLTARAYTNAGLSSTSGAAVVNVESPPPTVTITTPTAGSKVSGKITITSTAATDPSQDDYPTSISIYDGANYINDFSCQGQQTCAGQVTWEATGMSGQHSLTAKVSTNRGVSVTSAATAVTVVSPRPTAKITYPLNGSQLGQIITVRASGATDPTQTDYPTSISVYDESNYVGNFGCQGQRTCAGSVRWDARQLKGRHALIAKIQTERGLSAASAPVFVGIALKRGVSLHCTLSTHHAALRQAVHGHCTVTGAPAGTGIAIEYRSGGGFQAAVKGHVSSSGQYNFTLRGTRRASFDLWVVVGATVRTRSARAHIGTLTIG